jgi:protein ImuA
MPCAPHNEVFASGGEGSGAALALALALDGLALDRSCGQEMGERSLLWVQDAVSLRLNGRPYRAGLPPALRGRVIHVLAPKPEDALFALEEGIRCRDMACVIGEIAGNPKALDFTASRRLTLATERYGVPLFLVRHDAQRDLSSARMRWQVRSAASPPPQWNAAAPGTPAWHAELFRARTLATGEWSLRDDGKGLAAERHSAAPDHGDLAAAAGGRSLAAS